MKVLQLTSRFARGGTEATILQLMNGSKKGSTLLCCSAEDDAVLREHQLKFVDVPLFPSTALNLLKSCIILRGVVRTFAPHIIVGHHRFALLAGRIVAKTMGLPFVRQTGR